MAARVISGIVALTYLAIASLAGGAPLAMRLAIFLVLPLGCIWFSEEIGDLTGWGFRPVSASPGWMVAAGGWVLLLIPAMLGLIWYLSARP